MEEVAQDAESLPRRPSSDLTRLSKQLLRALAALEQGDDAETDFRAYLAQAQLLAWRGVADGQFDVTRAVLDALLPSQSFIDRHKHGPASSPQLQAVAELQATINMLYVAEDALATRQVEARLGSEEKSLSEREVLRVLVAEPRYLRRGEVAKRLPHRVSVSGARVGQILVALYHDGLLLRAFGKAQGRSETAFYALSPPGRELCQRLGLDRPAPSVEVVDREWSRYLPTAADEAGPVRTTITAFAAVQGGLGRSTALAHCAYALADRPAAGRVLVIDLDPPGLDACLAPEARGDCRGFAGLFEDYLAAPRARRQQWLAEAVTQAPYVLHPSPRLPNLCYMPAGRDPGAVGHVVAQYGGSGESSFAGDLRAVLPGAYARALIDAPSKQESLVQPRAFDLADSLVVFIHPHSDARSLQALLEVFQRRHAAAASPPNVAFAFSQEPDGIGRTTWITRNLSKSSLPPAFRAVRVARSSADRIPPPGEWWEAHAGLLRLLEYPAVEEHDAVSLETSIAAALAVFQDDDRPYVRKVAKGLITSCRDDRLPIILGKLEERKVVQPASSQALVSKWLVAHQRVTS